MLLVQKAECHRHQTVLGLVSSGSLSAKCARKTGHNFFPPTDQVRVEWGVAGGARQKRMVECW